MSSTRLLRPFARALQQGQQSRFQAIARPSTAAFSSKSDAKSSTLTTTPNVPSKTFGSTSKVLMAGMPQLVPFYFMNEVTVALIGTPIAIYVLSKYILPQTVRQRMARLFITKL